MRHQTAISGIFSHIWCVWEPAFNIDSFSNKKLRWLREQAQGFCYRAALFCYTFSIWLSCNLAWQLLVFKDFDHIVKFWNIAFHFPLFISWVWLIHRVYHRVYHSWTWTKWGSRHSGSISRTIWHDTWVLMDILWLFLWSNPWPFSNWMVPETTRSPIIPAVTIDLHPLPWYHLCTILCIEIRNISFSS